MRGKLVLWAYTHFCDQGSQSYQSDVLHESGLLKGGLLKDGLLKRVLLYMQTRCTHPHFSEPVYKDVITVYKNVDHCL